MVQPQGGGTPIPSLGSKTKQYRNSSVILSLFALNYIYCPINYPYLYIHMINDAGSSSARQISFARGLLQKFYLHLITKCYYPAKIDDQNNDLNNDVN